MTVETTETTQRTSEVPPEPPPTAPRRPSATRMLALIVLLLAVGTVGYWYFFARTYHLATVQPGVLYRDGNQSIRRFDNAIKRVQPKTVVCLVDDKEMASERKPQFAQEVDYLKEKGIRLERISVPLGGWPTSEDVRRFLDLVSRSENQPVLVHCAQGVRRTGMMVAAYQMSVQDYDKEKAKEAILTFGHSERTVGDVKKFIDHYDPEARTTVVFPVSPGKE